MGFFGDLLSTVSQVVAGVLPGTPIAALAGGISQLAGGPTQVAGVPITTPTQVAAQQAAIAAAAPAAVTTVGAGVLAGAQAGLTVGQAAAIGNGAIFTRTVVQRVSRTTGQVVSAEIKRGSPFLMNIDVRALKRVTKLIRLASSKIPSKTLKVSAKVLDAAVTARIVQLHGAQALLHNGNHHT